MKKSIILILFLMTILTLFSIRNWENFTNTDAVYKIFPLNQNLYIGTWGGLDIFNTQSESFVDKKTTVDGLSDSEILDILKIGNTFYYVTKTNGVDIFRDEEKLVSLNQTTGLLSNNSRNIVYYDNRIFVGTDAGLSVFQINDDYPYPLITNSFTSNNGLLDNQITTLTINNDGFLFIGTSDGLSMVHADSMMFSSKWKHITRANSNIQSNMINDIKVKNDLLIFCTDNGLYKSAISDLNQSNLFTSFFTGDSVNVVYIDQLNQIWCAFGKWKGATYNYTTNYENKQIAMINEDGIHIKTFLSTEDKTVITTFTQINDVLYAGTWGQGLASVTTNNNQINISYYENNSIASNVISDMLVDDHSNLYICDGYQGGVALARGTKGISRFDGTTWKRFNVKNSQLLSNNVYKMDKDHLNRKWFGTWDKGYTGWSDGVSVLNDENIDQPVWQNIRSGLLTTTIAEVKKNDWNNDMWVVSSTLGINVINENFQFSSPIYMSNLSTQDIQQIHFTNDKIFFGTVTKGINYWDSSSIPPSSINHWKRPTPTQKLNEGMVYGITSYEKDNYSQVWMALNSGIFMFDNYNWYEFNNSRKRKVWIQDNFYDDIYYYADEEKLFAGISSSPSCIFADPFGRVWIGSNSAGISIYDIYLDRYTNFNISNSPLLSNTITSFAYDPVKGKLFIGTAKGLNSVEIGKEYKTTNVFGDIVVYPNPFNPSKYPLVTLKNKNAATMPIGSNTCKIFDLNGQLVKELKENRFFEFDWDGKNDSNKNCGSGIYFYLIETPQGSAKGKIVLIR